MHLGDITNLLGHNQIISQGGFFYKYFYKVTGISGLEQKIIWLYDIAVNKTSMNRSTNLISTQIILILNQISLKCNPLIP